MFGLGWLIPNHYLPWASAWNDGVVILVLLFAGCLVISRSKEPVSVPILSLITVMLVLMTAFLQYTGQRIEFRGDAIVVAFYGCLWLLAVVVGSAVAQDTKNDDLTLHLFGGWAFFSILSAGVGISQWLRAPDLGIYAAEVGPGILPFGNLGQRNNFSTVCFLGICSVFLLRDRLWISRGGFWVACIFLMIGMASARSRTGILQIGLLAIAGSIRSRAEKPAVERRNYTFVGLFFLFLMLLWPSLCDALFLQSRSAEELTVAGGRLAHWISMVDAISREPWFGYGWAQAGAAQQRVAIEHPFAGEYFEHTHNFIIDIFIWIGVPFGVLLLSCLMVWFFRCWVPAVRSSSEKPFLLSLFVLGILLHGLLEFPLEYAYFLIPLGLAIGLLEKPAPQAVGGTRWSMQFKRRYFFVFLAILGSMYAWIAIEYLESESDYRIVRMEAARIGVMDAGTLSKPKLILDQLDAFQHFMLYQATPNMRPEDVEWMRQIALRFGYPPVLFRYALAAALNGQVDGAKKTLRTLCRIHEESRCLEAREGWAALQLHYPQLQGIDFPEP